ncbi:transmembrane alpha-helix domain-containing protein [Fusarium mundagurra]|uniref:Transmembrane alpha-helix domain-containing protein n=1 Tax=Fusarium mundagurra TaxID=1567541 RepID=A0A8H5YLA5_9HYPO|nr:transmembrane alpha-helix domain-containing protein [Fusarium mundagurra]
MTPAFLMARLPPFLVISGVLNLATGHVLPQPTKTVDFYELNVLPYPLAATPAPDDSLLLRRQFNTVCGYLGGDPGLPATCSAGSHCVVDVDHGAVGCCPDGGSLDHKQRNKEKDNNDGHFRHKIINDKERIYKIYRNLLRFNNRTESDTSTETTASETADPSSTESGDSDAPDTDGNDNGSKNTGDIIGGTIGGVAALAALIVLGIWLWKRKKGNTRQGPGVKHQVQHIGPPLDNNHNFAPVPLMHETDKMAPPPPVPVRNQQRTMNSAAGHEEPFSEPWDPSSNNYGYGNSAGAVGGSSHMEHDEVPLTRDDDFDHSYNSGLGRISEEHPRPGTAISTPGQMSQVYPGPRGGGGGPLWQQNRGPGWF